MSRIPQQTGSRGSLKWIQRSVAKRPDLLQPTGFKSITWRSPLEVDEYSEYRDSSFLDVVGVSHLSDELRKFWPRRGPQWDALGNFGKGGVVLVEAKAHLAELKSAATQSSGASRSLIEASLEHVAGKLGADGYADWSTSYYQYANRLAHLWWLRKNGVNAHLVLVSFIDDVDMEGPSDKVDWDCAYHEADLTLGLPSSHMLSEYVHHVFPSVLELQ